MAEETTDTNGVPAGSPSEPQEPKTYDEKYVKDLRDEAVKHRFDKKEAEAKAKEANKRLLDARVEALGQDMADPHDLFAWTAAEGLLGEDGFPDDEAIKAAIENLLTQKPHLRTRDARGDIDQGGRGENVETFSFNDWLRSAAE